MKNSLLILLCLCGVAQAEPFPDVTDNSGEPIAEQGAVRPSAPNALYEMMGRIEQLQAEVQQLTGKVEEQAYLIGEMKKSQKSLYSEFDERMQALEKKAEASQANIQQPPEDTGLTETKVPEPPTVQPPEVKQDAPVTTVQAPVQPTAAVSGVDEKQQYQQAYDALRNGHTAQAISEFNALLAKNAKGEFASNAQYWLGEAYRVNQDIDLSRKAFSSVIENYPDSAKVPDALLKLGTLEADQKNTKKAREYLTRVTMDYASSNAAHLAAKKLLLLDDVKY